MNNKIRHTTVLYLALALQFLYGLLPCAYADTSVATYLSPVSMFNVAPPGGLYCHPSSYPNLYIAEGLSAACRDEYPNVTGWTSVWILQASGYQFVRWYHAYYGDQIANGEMVINMSCPQGGAASTTIDPGWCFILFQPMVCSTGQQLDSAKSQCVSPGKRSATRPANCQCAGDPINSGSGNAYEEFTDYKGDGSFPLVFGRAYNSALTDQSSSPYGDWVNENIGQGWSTNVGAHLDISYYSPSVLTTPCTYSGVEYFCPSVSFTTYYMDLTVWHADGGQEQFSYTVKNNVLPTVGSVFSPEAGSAGELSMVNLPSPLTGSGYKYLRDDGYAEYYDTTGDLLAVQDPHGLMQTYQYTDLLVASVTDPFGRQLKFTYNSNNQIATMTNPAGGVYTYSYDSNGNLIKVTYPDNSAVQYQYTNATYKNALTGIIDEDDNQYVTYTYDSQGRATSSVNGTTGANGTNADPFSIVYNSDGSATVTEPTGEVRTLTFTSIDDAPMFSSATAPCTECGDKSQSIGYDTHGHMNSATDFDGNVTHYSYDAAGRILSETDAYGTTVARTTTTAWDTTRNLPSLITQPARKTSYARTATVWTTTVTDRSTSVARATTYNYSSTGLLTSVSDPLGHVTSFTYDSQGDIATITNALNQVTQITSYDANGYPLTIIDPNGVETILTYDQRQRLLTRTVDGEETQFGYDPAGNLIKVTLPTGTYLQYDYDSAHRLTSINDNLNDTITYTLDALGNRTVENTTDPSNLLTRTLQRTFNSLNQLKTLTGGAGQVTQYTEDTNGNVTGITDPMNNAYSQLFDALNRLSKMVDPLNGSTIYSYDSMDRLTKLTDPRALNTTYSYDGFDDLTKQVSPDTGTTTDTYDLDGNRLTKKDARGITATYGYDALNRLTGITYPISAEDVSFSYDQGTNGIGRLTGITDQSGSTTLQYDPRGNLIQKTATIGGHAFTVSYGYDAADNLTSITYPNGTQVTYDRDAVERITSVQSSSGGTVVSGITYEPFGPITGLTYGNGLTDTRTYDQDYRLTGITDPNILSWTLGHNADDDITGITDNLVGSNSQTLGYDNLNRLNAGSGNYGSLSYKYDADGNRNQGIVNGTTTNYTYGTGNRLTKINSTTISYDADGSQVGDGTYTYSYDDSERLGSVTKTGTTASYIYNGLGQRAEKTVNGTSTVFIYDESGHLVGEYTPSGTLIAEHIWLNDQPIGITTPAGLYYVQTDQLNTPRAITNASKQLVWEWSSDPFGTTAPNQNPSGLGIFTYNLRFPGQYYDAETGHNYNYFRDYDPSIGRYIESDPVGLNGGISTYVYVDNGSLNYADSFGLAVDINLFDKTTDPIDWQYANDYKGNPDECTVSGHGNPDFVGGLTPQRLAYRINHTSSCNGKPVRLLACSTGEKPVDTDRINEGLPYGENLSNDLHRIVWAPETWGWYFPNGSYEVYPTMHNLDYPVGPAAALQDGPNMKLPGKFIEFGGP